PRGVRAVPRAPPRSRGGARRRGGAIRGAHALARRRGRTRDRRAPRARLGRPLRVAATGRRTVIVGVQRDSTGFSDYAGRWKEFLVAEGAEVRVLDLLGPDPLSQLRGCDGVMWN